MVKEEKKLAEILNKMKEKGVEQGLLFLFKEVKPIFVLMINSLENDKKEIFEILEKIKDAERSYRKLVRVLKMIREYPWIIERAIIDKGAKLIIAYNYEFGNFVDEVIFGNKERVEERIKVLNEISEKIRRVLKEIENNLYSNFPESWLTYISHCFFKNNKGDR